MDGFIVLQGMRHLSLIKAFVHDHYRHNRKCHTTDFVIGEYFLDHIYA